MLNFEHIQDDCVANKQLRITIHKARICTQIIYSGFRFCVLFVIHMLHDGGKRRKSFKIISDK